MPITRWFTTTASLSASLLLAQPGLAAVDSTELHQFSDAAQSYLVKHHQRLFAINETGDGTIAVFRSSKAGEEWTRMSDEAIQIADLVESTSEIDAFGVFGKQVYMATKNSNGEPEIWRMCKWCRPAEWTNVSDGALDNENEIIDLFIADLTLWALTAGDSGNALYRSDNGSDWEQVGEVGLGQSITNAVGVSRMKMDDVRYVYLATEDGVVYRATAADPTTWSMVTTVEGTVTAIHGINVATTIDGIAYSYHTEDGLTYIQGSEPGLGNTNNSAVTRYFKVRGGVYAVTENVTDGTEIRRWNSETSLWDLVSDQGFGDSDNTAVTSLVPYRGLRYASTVNETDGPTIYRLHADED